MFVYNALMKFMVMLTSIQVDNIHSTYIGRYNQKY